MNKKEFGAWLKEERNKAGLTQDEMAKALGLKFSQEIAAFEAGTSSFPTHRLGALASALKVDKEKVFQMHLKTKETELRKKMDQA